MNGLEGYAGALPHPLLQIAIESTRVFLEEDDDFEGVQAPIAGVPALAAGPDASKAGAKLMRWQPDVRQSVLAAELAAGLAWEEREGGGVDLLAGKTPLVQMTPPKGTVLAALALQVADRARERAAPRRGGGREDRMAEILCQVTPPIAFWCTAIPIRPAAMPRTLELIGLTLAFAGSAVQQFKHRFDVPRAHEVDARVMPALLVPGHSSFPSGHATEAYAVAGVLGALLDPQGRTPAARAAKSKTPAASAAKGKAATAPLAARRLLKLASRIADNREVAGLHYAVDSLGGQLLGSVLAAWVVARCVDKSPCVTGEFRGAELQDEDVGLQPDPPTGSLTPLVLKGGNALASYAIGPKVPAGRASPELAWLWSAARAEWAGR